MEISRTGAAAVLAASRTDAAANLDREDGFMLFLGAPTGLESGRLTLRYAAEVTDK
jgi:hypothetical protein